MCAGFSLVHPPKKSTTRELSVPPSSSAQADDPRPVCLGWAVTEKATDLPLRVYPEEMEVASLLAALSTVTGGGGWLQDLVFRDYEAI